MAAQQDMQAGFADSEYGEDAMTPDNNPAGSVELCIQIAPDGGMTVYKEMPGADGQQQESERQQVADIGQALAAVLKLYKAMDAGQNDARKQFTEGFGDEPKPQRMIG